MKKRGLSFRIITNMNAAYGWGGLMSIPAFRGSIKPEPSNDGPWVIQVQTSWLPNLGETFHLYGKHGRQEMCGRRERCQAVIPSTQGECLYKLFQLSCQPTFK